jgi:mono/diheme cytochrome c family protein
VIARLIAVFGVALLTAACDVSMTQQPKYRTYAPSELWENGTSAQPLPEGVVAQSTLARDEVAANPPKVTSALLARGRERFDIFCSPCHGLDGGGAGVIVHHGFPNPPDFHSGKMLALPARSIFDTITNGYGVMYSYAARVEPADRWAITAYIRALQLSGHAKLTDFPEAKERLAQ